VIASIILFNSYNLSIVKSIVGTFYYFVKEKNVPLKRLE